MNFLHKHFRFFIQSVFFIYILGIGFRFYYYLQSLSQGDYDVIKPFGVEGFLPISALLGLKQFIMTGVYDKVHPAGLTIFIAAIVMSLIFKKSFCAYVCPIGFVSEQVSKFGLKVKMPKFVHYPLTSLKYVLLGFFIYFVFFIMDIQRVTGFINSPYNKISDAKMMTFFISPSKITIIVVTALVVLTLIFKNFWCRYLCPYGALLGLVSFLSPFKVKRNKEACVSCGKCASVCPMDIPVDKRDIVFCPECFGCMNCINNRQNERCLSNGIFTNKPIIEGFLTISIFLTFFIVAYFVGCWISSVTNTEYAMFLKMMDIIGH